MKKYILKRSALLLFLLFAVATAVFFLVHLIPGDPAAGILGEGADSRDIQRVRSQLNLDKPLFHQYLHYLEKLVQLDFGESLVHGEPVSAIILTALPNTFYLAFLSMLTGILISFPLGAWAAFKEDTVTDASITLVSSIGLAIPNFVLGPLLIIVFSVALGWLPASGSGGFRYIILPVLTLSLSISAFLTRMIKTSLAAELKKPYVLLARAKGLTDVQVFKRHILKNAMIPISTTMGLQFGALLTGTVITETIFSWQGIGSLMVNAIQQRDYPLIQGLVLVITVIYLFVNALVDLSYPVLDPKIRYGIRNRHSETQSQRL